jgi:CubicO group peptidase (beta-lactamase class C family)
MRWSRRKRIVVSAVAFGAMCLVIVVPPAWAALRGATGYAARIYADAVFVQGRTVESVRDEEFAVERPLEGVLRPLLDVTVDRGSKSVVVSALGVSATAAHREGCGAVVLPDGAAATAAVRALDAAAGAVPGGADAANAPNAASATDRRGFPAASAPWPLGDAAATAELPPAARARIDRVLDAAFAEPAEGPRLRTRAVLAVHRGRIVAERYGSGFDAHTPLLGWSMSKSVTSALVGLRVDEGRIDVDRPLPWPVYLAGDARAAITWRDHLRMSSGLAWAEDYAPGGTAVGMLFVAPDAAAFVADLPAAAPPGTRFVYSSATTNVLCRALRTLCRDDADWLSWPRRALFEPLGMRGAVFATDATGTFVGSSFVYAPARDWARFGLLYLGRGTFAGRRVLSPEWVAASTEPAPAAPRGRYGLHWWLNRGPPGDPAGRPWPALPVDAFRADGYEGQSVTVVPSAELVVVRLGVTKTARCDASAFVADMLAALRSE